LALKNTAPDLFERDVDRNQTEMPDYYLPTAPGVLIAGVGILHAAVVGWTPRRVRTDEAIA
jgi:hypothetical protein